MPFQMQNWGLSAPFSDVGDVTEALIQDRLEDVSSETGSSYSDVYV